MITIEHTNFTTNIALADILAVKTKADMLKICKKLDLYVSPNLKKDETARRVSQEILYNPLQVLEQLRKVIPHIWNWQKKESSHFRQKN